MTAGSGSTTCATTAPCSVVKGLYPVLKSFFLILALAVAVSASDQEQTCEAGDQECASADAAAVADDGSAWGVPQDTADARVADLLKTTDDFMKNKVMVEEQYKHIRSNCKNRHELCAYWAVIGECDVNPKYMALHCAPVCQSCELLDFETRCPFDKDAPTALTHEGELNALFERIMTLPHYQQFEPNALSKPGGKQEDDDDDDLINGPWVITLDKFLSPQECQELIELGAIEGYERSSDVGEAKFDGTFDSYENEGRTSTNAWCVDDCYKNATVQAVLERMENLTGIPKVNYEYLQMLQYEETQFYQTHHDYIEHHRERSEGPRILTLFLYLNTVQEGGGTNFPTLGKKKGGLTVPAVQGKALLWPSVLDKNPNAKDGRTTHQALPVIRGRKWGANAWLHQRDFQEPYNRSCH